MSLQRNGAAIYRRILPNVGLVTLVKFSVV